jgi:hypothetical protein
MTELELNKKLALAIGWREDQMEQIGRDLCMRVEYFKVFDYTDWRVIGPIAQRFKAFPLDSVRFKGMWYSHLTDEHYDTPQLAIAMAVIQGAGK